MIAGILYYTSVFAVLLAVDALEQPRENVPAVFGQDYDGGIRHRHGCLPALWYLSENIFKLVL